MYNLIYTVPFTNVDGEALTVQILEDGGTGLPVELTGGTPPFIVDVNDEDFLYTPTRFSGATLKLVGSDYLQKLFSTQYQKFKVNLVKAGSVIWTGFITPELYSQDYDNSLFELEIECISALSTLEYIDYKQEGSTISLLGLIRKCITESKGDFRAVYIPNTYTSSLDGITVSTANFIDEDGKAMTLKECLEEVCKFLNWTVTEYDGCVYFIDVDYIKAGKTAYTNILTNTSVILSSTINLQAIPSKGNSNSLSLLGGYNKVVIIDSDYEADKDQLYPELEFANDTKLHHKAMDRDGKRYQKEYYDTTVVQLFTYKYNTSSNSYESTSDSMFNNVGKQLAGSIAVQQSNYEIDNMPNKLNWDKMIEIKQYEDGYSTVGNNTFLCRQSDSTILAKYPVIKTKTSSSTLVFDPSIKLAVNFQIYPLADDLNGYIGDFNYKIGGTDNFDLDGVYVLARLRCGDYWYNGTTWTINSNNSFKIYTDITRKNVVGEWFYARNTNDFTQGVNDLTGTIINFDKVIIGDLELVLYNPKFETAVTYFILKDITIDSQKVSYSTVTKDDNKEDTKYENVVNESYINALDDIEFKITSKNDSELSFSKAIIGGLILDKLANTIYNSSDKPEELLIKRIINQYQQPKIKLAQIVKPIIFPYSIITDSYLSGKKFLFTGGTVDYEDNSIECNMIELN